MPRASSPQVALCVPPAACLCTACRHPAGAWRVVPGMTPSLGPLGLNHAWHSHSLTLLLPRHGTLTDSLSGCLTLAVSLCDSNCVSHYLSHSATGCISHSGSLARALLTFLILRKLECKYLILNLCLTLAVSLSPRRSRYLTRLPSPTVSAGATVSQESTDTPAG